MSGEKFFALKTIVLILSIYFGSWILYYLLFGDIVGPKTQVLTEELLDVLLILLLLRTTMQTYTITLSEIAMTLRFPWRNAALGLILGVILWLGGGIISDLLNQFIPSWAKVPAEFNFAVKFINAHGIEKFVLFFVLSLSTPVMEEVFFRGLIYSMLRRSFSVQGAVILSSFFLVWNMFIQQ